MRVTSSTVFKMLCQVCENIFSGDFYSLHNCSPSLANVDSLRALFAGTINTPKSCYRTHQSDFSRLYQSALKECWICAQIFEDICKKSIEEDLFPQNSTRGEIARRILEATSEVEKTESASGNFTVYVFTVNGGDITLCISVDYIHSPWSGSYQFNLAEQRGTLINAA